MIAQSLFAIMLSGNVLVTVADETPRFDIETSCRRSAEQLQGRMAGTSSLSVQERAARCVKTEEDARARLVTVWSRFPPDERTTCIGASSSGGTASYVELLVCLGMKEEVRKLRQSNPGGGIPPPR